MYIGSMDDSGFPWVAEYDFPIFVSFCQNRLAAPFRQNGSNSAEKKVLPFGVSPIHLFSSYFHRFSNFL